MRKRFLVLLLLGFFISGYSQTFNDTLQTDKSNNFNLKGLTNNDSSVLIEKVYLHIDRMHYYAGDDIWFKAYLVDAIDHTLTDHSGNLHVELISPASKIFLSRVINLKGGLGNGDFRLPDTLISGRYKIRAYTNYMRNFSDQLFFSKEIFVISPTDNKDEFADSVKYIENKILLSFFPEGGSLIDNVSSNVAFKATNSIGKGCEINGKVYSSNGALVATFRSTHLGMGSFFLRPLPGLSYYSVFKGADSIEVRTELPKSFPDGTTFSAILNQNNELIITTKSNPQTFQSEHDLLLSISLRKEILKTVLCKVNSPITHFVIPTNELPDGIVMLTLSTAENTPLAERLIYIQREPPISIKIETGKLLYSKREPVSLKISLSGDSPLERNANVSLAVINKSLTQNTTDYPGNISSWFLLESDIRGSVENPSYYFYPSNGDRLRDLNLLLLTQGWRDFSWKYDEAVFLPENGFTVSGRLRKYSFNKPIKNSRVSVGIFGSNSSILETLPVDSTGRFRVSGLDFTGDARLIVTGIGKKDRLQGELHLDSIIFIPAKLSDSLSPVLKLAENKWSILKTYFEINESTRRKYKLSDTISLGEVKIIAERHKDPQTVKIERSRNIYVQPDAEVKITQQMLGNTYLIEILRGHVAGVVVEGSFPNYRVYIRGFTSIHAQSQPLILVDGMSATLQDLIYMPIPVVDRIDVLKTVATAGSFGLRGSNGVINIITRAGGVWAYIPVKYSINKKISGYNAARVFYSPQHLDDSNSALGPDLRSTLLWEPAITLNGKKEAMLNYYNGDNSSVIKVIAEGITTTGIPITGEAEYEVREE